MEKVAERMRHLCSRREYCRADIRKKALSALDGDADMAQKVVDMLVKEKYVDDMRYASAFVRDKSALSGWGVTKIRFMLSSKGIEKDIIEAALSDIDAEKAGLRLTKLMENKYRSLKDDPQCRLKMLRFAMGRGYGYGQAESVIEKLMKDEEI